ncbi:MAG TPA: cation:proton antiporter [bacterium]|nr:cation:proton antiporter [bacterium]
MIADAAAGTINAVVSNGDHEFVSMILFQLLLVFFTAKAVGYVFARFKQPVVVGELLTGVIMGPYVLNILQLNEPNMHLTFEVIAEAAVIVLLFLIGLETKISDMTKVGWRSFWVAAAGVFFPFLFGYLYMKYTGNNDLRSMFMGAVMVATSVGITARILKELDFLSADVSRIILGAAVIDDILGLVVLSVLSGAAESHKISAGVIAVTFGVIIVFVFLFTLGGVHVTKKYGYQIGKLKLRNAPIIAASVVCFTYAMVASKIGLAAIVGAFMAGVVMSERESEFKVKEKIEVIDDLIGVFFFTIMGAKVNIHAFMDPAVLGAGLALTLLAFGGKFIGCALPVMKMGVKKASFIGMGMVPRGEVGIIIAAYALSKGVIDDKLYGVAILMVLITTFVPPFFLQPMIKAMKKDKH